MGNAATASSDSFTRVEWMWNSSADPFSKSKPPEWLIYSDVENMIIEEASIAGKTHAMLDDYHIDFTAVNTVKSRSTNKTILYIGVPNSVLIQQHTPLVRTLFTRTNHNKIYNRNYNYSSFTNP